MGRLWQAAGTVNAVLAPDLLERPWTRACGACSSDSRRSMPKISPTAKYQNMRPRYGPRFTDCTTWRDDQRELVFGMDGDDPSVFARTVEWAIEQGIETATFHILTPYPGTALYRRIAEQDRLTSHDWDLTTPPRGIPPTRMSADQLESGYRWPT